ncbi:MAG: hypothetical protein H0U09_15680 [Geodermatophilaceae bacterium]|nr:hypothetical protein [Geodermatophilaceae bacterium]
MSQQQQGGTVELEEIRAAVKALEASEADGSSRRPRRPAGSTTAAGR